MSEVLKIRKRTLPGYTRDGYVQKSSSGLQKGPYVDGGGTGERPPTLPPSTRKGFQITESTGTGWPKVKNRPKGDVGSSFMTTKQTVTSFPSIQTVFFQSGGIWRKYTGLLNAPIATVSGNPAFPPNAMSSKSELEAKGAEAVAACNPLNPIADMSVTLAEIQREGIPVLPGIRLWQSRLKPLLGIAEEILNAEFGWLPLQSEIKTAAKAISNASALIAQFTKDSGRHVRRHFNYPIEQSTSESATITDHADYGNGSWSIAGLNSALTGDLLRSRVTTRRTWFSGAFTYHITPGQTGLESYVAQGSAADHLLGTAMTPEIIWELTPWSWAVDWFSNTQQVVENLESFKIYGLVMQYGYIMEETSTIDTYTLVNVHSPVVVSPVRVITTSKRRVRANPFGFGVSWEDLSPTQLAITAALGITRVL